MANYSENKIVFFSEDRVALKDLWQKIYTYYVNNGNGNSIYNFLLKMGYSINEVNQMTDLRNVFTSCDDKVTDDEFNSFFYIETETAWESNLEVFYDIIRDIYDNKIDMYAIVEESGCNIFINTDIDGTYLGTRYKLDCFINNEEMVKYFENFGELKQFVQQKFTKIKLMPRDDSEIIIRKITKAYKLEDDEDFCVAIHHFGYEYPF